MHTPIGSRTGRWLSQSGAYGFLASGLIAGGVLVGCATHSVFAARRTSPPAVRPIPPDYREWIYLSSGLDMTYTSTKTEAKPPDHESQFDNVFVNPRSYASFKRDGKWPDETVFVLENREALKNASINQAGRTQGEKIVGVELHVKENASWSFYELEADGKEHLIPRPAGCYTCHEAHAAVDTTFVQFYPTLLPLAESKGVLSKGYKLEGKTGSPQ